MFNSKILEVLKRNNRNDPFNSYGEHVTMTGGIRYGLHPTPEMDFQPDNLYTGRERYEDIKPRMVGGMSGGRLEAYRGGSTKSIGKSLSRGLKKVGKVVVPMATDVGKNIVKNIATKQGQAYIEKQLAKYALPAAETALMVAAGRSRSGGDKRTARAHLVRKIMQEHGCSLPEASKYIKDNDMSY